MGGREGAPARAVGPARGRVPPLRDGRAAASPDRGVEIHRPAHADARRQAACAQAGRRRRSRAPATPALCLAEIDARRLVFVDGSARSGTVRSRRAGAGPHDQVACRCARGRRCAGLRPARRFERGRERCRVRAQHGADGRWRRDRGRAGANIARPIHLVFVTAGEATGVFARSLRDGRGGCERRAHREPRRSGRRRLPGQHGGRPRGRRRRDGRAGDGRRARP